MTRPRLQPPKSNLGNKITDQQVKQLQEEILCGVANVFDLFKPGRTYRAAFKDVFEYLMEATVNFGVRAGAPTATELRQIADTAQQKVTAKLARRHARKEERFAREEARSWNASFAKHRRKR